MKHILLILLISTAALAKDSYLTIQEIKKVEGYLGDICPDTYCGGDLQYSPSNLKCNEDSCSINFSAKGYKGSSKISELGILGRMVSSEENEDVLITYLTYQNIFKNEMQMSFICTFKNLSENSDLYSDQIEMFYVMTLDCISELENTIFDYRY